MILADTSVLINHFRSRHPRMAAALIEGQVLIHPFVIGELACGNLPNRHNVLQTLEELRSAPMVSHEEVLALIEVRKLSGSGIGYIDAHLLASALISKRTKIWTNDKRLAEIATRLDVGYSEP
jgi:predicted nucleic acid-binding protein